MLSAQEVVFAQERGIPIIDVRPQEQYDKVCEHCANMNDGVI